MAQNGTPVLAASRSAAACGEAKVWVTRTDGTPAAGGVFVEALVKVCGGRRSSASFGSFGDSSCAVGGAGECGALDQSDVTTSRRELAADWEQVQ
jgi:hypothetical protein